MTASIRLRKSQLDVHRQAVGLTSDAALARAAGVQESTVWRVLQERSKPGVAFIAGLLMAFPACEFRDLFEVVRETAEEEAA